MDYPILQKKTVIKERCDTFHGYHHRMQIGDTEWYDMQNLDGNAFPALGTREKQKLILQSKTVSGLVGKDSLCYTDGPDFVINSYHVPLELDTDKVPKTLISMGAYVIIMPDKKYVNTENLADFGNIENTVAVSHATLELCREDATPYDSMKVQTEAPENPKNGELWMDTSAKPPVLKQYAAVNTVWTAVPTTCVKITAMGIGEHFKSGDGIMLSGITGENQQLNGAHILTACGTDFIVFHGILPAFATEKGTVTAERRMPRMDFVMESGNRLWGCRYGISERGEPVNEIYASKLGDFKNWNCFSGISTDSYAVTVGSDGPFTGACTYLSHPLFFKEDCIHKIYGSYPGDFQVQTTFCDGVQKGSAASLVTVNSALYYKSENGICLYDGSLPRIISDALGDVHYENAVAGADGDRYYISMADNEGIFRLFVLDTRRGIWYRRDDTGVVQFCHCNRTLYYLDDSGRLVDVHGKNSGENLNWYAESGLFGLHTDAEKVLNRLDVRLYLPLHSHVRFYVRYDENDSWEPIASFAGSMGRNVTIPVRPKPCDHFRIRMEGTGDIRILSITKYTEVKKR